MKKRFLIGGVLAGLLLGGVPTWAESGEGGIDGGGGNARPVELSNAEAVLNVVQEGKLERRLYVKEKLSQYFRTPTLGGGKPWRRLQPKLYGGERTLWDVLEETEIEVRMDQACYDALNNEVDGSIHASMPGAICISASRVGSKVTQETVRSETQALIFHELSHLLGATEEEAKDWQIQLAEAIKSDRYNTPLAKVEILSPIFEDLSNGLAALLQDFDKMQMPEVLQRLGDIFPRVEESRNFSTGRMYSIYTAVEYEFAGLQQDRFKMAYRWVSAQMEQDPAEKRRLYESIFQGQESLAYSDFRTLGRNLELIGNERIFKIHNAEEFKQQIRELQVYYQAQAEYVRCLKDNLPLPKLHGPWDQAK